MLASLCVTSGRLNPSLLRILVPRVPSWLGALPLGGLTLPRALWPQSFKTFGREARDGAADSPPQGSGSMLSPSLWLRRTFPFLLRSASRLPALSQGGDLAGTGHGRSGTMAVPSSARGLPLVAVCQVTSTPDKEQTFAACSGLIQEAAKLGACLAFLPEAFDFIARDPAETLRLSEPLGGDLVNRYAQLARECGLWLSLGGFHERGQDWEQTQRIYNCHVLLDSKGSIVATYRKTHLCDVKLPGQGSMCESTSTVPGPTLGSPVSTPAGKVGLAICYDLRFPELSLALAQDGAEILTYPSAFGSVTGPAHWEVLLRARAIETQCYVVAAAQWGQHHEKRGSYGHSMVVDPWGVVVARCSEGPGLCLAHIDLAYLRQVREQMPVAQHRRPDLYGNLGRPDP